MLPDPFEPEPLEPESLGVDPLGEDPLESDLLVDLRGDSNVEPREELLLRLVGVVDLLLDEETDPDLELALDEEREPALSPTSDCFFGASFVFLFVSRANALDFAIVGFFVFCLQLR